MSDKPMILVCDDESHILHVVSLKLRNAGYEVITASNGNDGLALALEHRPDLIITDYQMPGLTGVQVCAELRKDERCMHIPALMLTARGFRLEPSELHNARIAEVISKPFSPRDVLGCVKALIERQSGTSKTTRKPAAA
jgi:DNA-binding response OmpR family regulator